MPDFDRRILMELPVVKDKQNSCDSYYVTHHFYGKGYWIWIIPMTRLSILKMPLIL